jgi:hypothetical protein
MSLTEHCQKTMKQMLLRGITPKKKRFAVFPSPDGMSLAKLPLALNHLIITGQGEFGK